MFVYLSGYLPSPLELQHLARYQSIPFGIGLLLLYISLFTLTVDSQLYRYFRLVILLPLTIYYLWEACSLYHVFPNGFIVMGISTMCAYGILLALQYSVIQFCDSTKPRWVKTRKEGENAVSVYLSPESFSQRLLYALDLLCSLRGTSWLAGDLIEWDWVHPKHRIANAPRISRGQFLRNNLRDFILLFFTLDFLDVITKSRIWDWQRQDALYSIPLLQQCIHAFSLCIGTSILMLIDFTFTSTLAVGVFGMNPLSWPPLFYSPFQATSLTDFWSHRWHWIFRRTFVQMSIPATQLVQKLSGSQKGLPIVVIRAFSAFGVSAILHSFIMYHTQRWAILKLGDGRIDRVTFWDSDIVSFFMIQPFGMIFEKTILALILDVLFPPLVHTAETPLQKLNDVNNIGNETSSALVQAKSPTNPATRWEKVFINRIFTWSFLIWTGRWWTNKWIRGGLYHDGAKITPLSPIRSLWYRKLVA